MEVEETTILYDIESVVSFTATDQEQAETILDDFLEFIEDKGYTVQQATLSEAIFSE